MYGHIILHFSQLGAEKIKTPCRIFYLLNDPYFLLRTEMKMAGDHPASYQVNTSHTQDLVAAIGIPLLLILLTVPFTILRVLLLGWNCALTRQSFPDQDEDEDLHMGKASRSRNCLTVCCGVAGMMMFTLLLVLVVTVYIFVILQSVTSPLTKDPSD